MNIDEFKNSLVNLKMNSHNRKGNALYKPLLCALLLKKVREGHENKFKFKELREELSSLMTNYGGRGNGKNAHYPFFHLSSEPFYQIIGIEDADLSGDSAKVSALKRDGVYSRIDSEIYDKCIENQTNTNELIQFILESFWSETVYDELIDYFEIFNLIGIKKSNRRSHDFREKILRNYSFKCAFCGFQSVFNSVPGFGLDAAHILWSADGGGESLDNGLALCKLHHWSFDRGVISIKDGKILVSEFHVLQDELSKQLIKDLNGKWVEKPNEGSISEKNCDWHFNNKFKGN